MGNYNYPSIIILLISILSPWIMNSCESFHIHDAMDPSSRQQRHVSSFSPFTSSSTRGCRKKQTLDAKIGSGMPSSPGWKKGQLDRLSEWVANDEANRPIICEYEPDGFWLWTRWHGTVLSLIYKPVLLIISFGLFIDYMIPTYFLSSSAATTTSTATSNGSSTFSQLFSYLTSPVPTATEEPIIEQLQGLNKLWEYHLTLCTFTLTFFTSEAYKYWRNVYFTTRAIQGRINDICLLLTIGAEKQQQEKEDEDNNNDGNDTVNEQGDEDDDNDITNDNEDDYPKKKSVNFGTNNNRPTTTGGYYSKRGSEIVELCTRYIRLSHTFFWAATPTCSDGLQDFGQSTGDEYKKAEPLDNDDTNNDVKNSNANENDKPLSNKDFYIGPLLLSPEGLRRLVNEGELTFQERQALITSGLPPSQYAYILLEWVGLHIINGMKSGILHNGNGYEENILRQLTLLRAEYFSIGDFTAGRMPLAYVQLQQVLVDSLVIIAPLALYPELGSYGLSIPLTVLLTFFYKGLLELSKSFLDPFGNEGYESQNIRVDVLVSELNFGAGSRWIKAGESSLPLPLPPPPNNYKNNNLLE